MPGARDRSPTRLSTGLPTTRTLGRENHGAINFRRDGIREAMDGRLRSSEIEKKVVEEVETRCGKDGWRDG